MRVKFSDIVKNYIKECEQCFQYIYSIPVDVDKSIAQFMIPFGEPKYDLDTLSLLQIESSDGYKIKGRLTNNYLYFSLPKEFKNKDLDDTRKLEFEKCLSKWIEHKLPVEIYM